MIVNDDDIVALMAAILYASNRPSNMDSTEDEAIERAYRLYVKTQERLRQAQNEASET